MSTDIMRLPTQAEYQNRKLQTMSGWVTNWKQCAILGLTVNEIMAIRSGIGSKQTVKRELQLQRRKMRDIGWVFPLNPEYSSADTLGLSRPFLQAIPPMNAIGWSEADEIAEQEIQQAETLWAAEQAAYQSRSSWGMRIKPGKAAGN